MFRTAFSTIVVMALTGCPSTHTQNLARPEAISANGPYFHEASGMTFPLAVGEYKRREVIRYDAQGLDASVSYDLFSPPELVSATVYVYPSPSIVSIGSSPDVVEVARTTMCINEYEARKQEIADAHPGAILTMENSAPPLNGKFSGPGQSATFEFERIFAGVHQPLESRLHLYCYVEGKWMIKYRFTYPRSFDDTQSINEFMQGLSWPNQY